LNGQAFALEQTEGLEIQSQRGNFDLGDHKMHTVHPGKTATIAPVTSFFQNSSMVVFEESDCLLGWKENTATKNHGLLFLKITFTDDPRETIAPSF
jgi:hypothetical protein